MIHFPKLLITLKKANKIILLVVCFLAGTLTLKAQVPGSNPQGTNDSVNLQLDNQRAMQCINEYKFDESKDLLHKALQIQENSYSYYMLSHIYNTEENWDEAIKCAQKSVAMSPGFMPGYTELFNAYSGANKWKDAEGISEQAQKGDPNGYIATQLQSLQSSLDLEHLSHVFVPLFFIILAIVFFLPVYKASQNGKVYFHAGGNFRFTEILLLAIGVSCFLRLLFYGLSHWIWSFNVHIPANEFAPPRYALFYEHDGIEPYSLYFLMFANIAVTLLIVPLFLKLKANKSLYVGVFSALLLVSSYYFFSIGFFPPMADMGSEGASNYLLIFITLAVLSVGLYLLYGKFKRLAKWLAIALIAMVTLVTIYQSSIIDLAFVLDPALRLMHGFKIPEVYFQYDLYLSFLAYAYMKFNIDISLFPYLGQISFFLLFLGAFLFSDGFFKTKGLSIFFIIALMLVRYYGVWDPNVMIFQIAPLRLDLWIIPVLIAYKMGVRHWFVGLSLGLLILFHRNLGIIYSLSYLVLLAIFFVLDVLALIQEKNLDAKNLSALLVTHLRIDIKGIAIIVASIALCFILFGGLFSASALMYTKVGIGMLHISTISFYWYVPVLLSCLGVYLVYCKNKLGEKYVSIGLFIAVLAIGNSMYFFGRSHENAVLCVSALLVTVLFVLFDVLVFSAPEAEVVTAPKAAPAAKGKKVPETLPAKKEYLTQKNVITFLPVVFILLVGYYYSERITNKVSAQYTNFKESQYTFPLLPPFDSVSLKRVTNNSDKLYFLDHLDFYYCYYANYAPQGYFSPCGGNPLKKDQLALLQDLLSKGYYIVYDAQQLNTYKEYFPYLKYNHTFQLNNLIFLKYDTVKPLLPDNNASLFHIEIADTLQKNGIDHEGLNLKGDFTIEAVIKPLSGQAPNAVILNNLSRYDGLKGFTIQCSGAPGQYVLAFSNGSPATPNAAFQLDDNRWHYLTITVNREFIKVYDNGKLVQSANAGGVPIANSELPLIIGNQASRDAHFRGYIREVKISDGKPVEAEIISAGQKLDAELNAANAPNP